MRWTWLPMVSLLLAASCSDDTAAPAPDPGLLADELSSSVPTSSTTTTTLRPPVPTDPPARPEAMIGDLVIPCTPSDAVAIAPRAGVSDDAIVIGTGSDRGGAATIGAGRGIVEMVEALADHCNAHGGLHGRDIRVVEYDAAAFETAARVTEACDEVVALVGHAFLQAVEEVLTAIECRLERYPGAASLVPSDPIPIHGHLTAAFADPAAVRIVLVGPDTPSAAAQRDRHQAAVAASAGSLEVVGSFSYPIDREPDWDRIVGDARFSGAGQVHLVGGCDHAVVPFAEVADRAGWEPVIVATATSYDEGCLRVPNPERFLIELPFLPFEDGDAAPAIAEHAELLDRVAAPRTGSGVLAASAFWRWAQTASVCLAGGDPDCLAAQVSALDGWTGGGLHPAVSADGTTEGCAVVMGIEDGGFVRRVPAEPGTYECGANFSVSAPG